MCSSTSLTVWSLVGSSLVITSDAAGVAGARLLGGAVGRAIAIVALAPPAGQQSRASTAESPVWLVQGQTTLVMLFWLCVYSIVLPRSHASHTKDWCKGTEYAGAVEFAKFYTYLI